MSVGRRKPSSACNKRPTRGKERNSDTTGGTANIGGWTVAIWIHCEPERRSRKVPHWASSSVPHWLWIGEAWSSCGRNQSQWTPTAACRRKCAGPHYVTYLSMPVRIITRRNAWECHSLCWKAAGMFGNGVPVVEVFKNALWAALWTIFRPKMH